VILSLPGFTTGKWYITARIINRPYELRDTDGKPISREEAWKLILSNYNVPEELKRERRRKTTNALLKRRTENREMASHRTNEAAAAPQPAVVL